jgi:hypothetical protein
MDAHGFGAFLAFCHGEKPPFLVCRLVSAVITVYAPGREM